MKCIHCSARVDRTDWFCPNCKRSVAREGIRSQGKVWLPITIALLVGTVVAGVALSQRHPRVEAQATVTIREVPMVRVTPETAAPEDEAPTAPKPRKRERVASIAVPEQKPEVPSSTEPENTSEPEENNVAGTGAVNVSTDQSVRTFVYLNGGTLLGEAPLRNAAIPAGKHTLVFWSPSVNGRSTRKVEVSPGGSVEVREHVRSQDQFREETGG